MTLKAAILDIDGTLIDSNDGHAYAWRDALQAFGYAVPFERIRPLIGMGGDKILPMVANGLEAESPEGKDMGKRRREIFAQRYLPDIEPFPDVRELLQRMQEDGLALIIASSASGKELDALLEKAKVKDLVEGATTADDVEHSKPDPDIIAAALKKAGVKPEEALMFGDTRYDIEAASKVGLRTIVFRSGGNAEDTLQGAFRIYDSPASLLAQYDDSPLMQAEARLPG